MAVIRITQYCRIFEAFDRRLLVKLTRLGYRTGSWNIQQLLPTFFAGNRLADLQCRGHSGTVLGDQTTSDPGILSGICL